MAQHWGGEYSDKKDDGFTNLPMYHGATNNETLPNQSLHSITHPTSSTQFNKNLHNQLSNRASKYQGLRSEPAILPMSLEQKFQCCQLHDSGITIKALCSQYKQSKITINNIILNKDKIVTQWFKQSNPYVKVSKRSRSSAYPEINTAIMEWYQASSAAGHTPTGVSIQSRARLIAQELGYSAFKASNGE